jgi:hypothetical protein|nr:MAG TPA: hypothetical protein [Caudoviricetes sp.]
MLHYPWDDQPQHDQEVVAISDEGLVFSAYYDYINGCFFSNPGYKLIDKKIIAWSELGEGKYIHEQVLNSEVVQFRFSDLATKVKHIYATIDPSGLVGISFLPYAPIEEITIKVEQDESN